jgi:hypothetical protein
MNEAIVLFPDAFKGAREFAISEAMPKSIQNSSNFLLAHSLKYLVGSTIHTLLAQPSKLRPSIWRDSS